MNGFIPDNPLAQNPFALSLSKGRSWFDKLTTNGFLRTISPNGLSGFIPILDKNANNPTRSW